MKHELKKVAVLLPVAALLAACGGGGGDTAKDAGVKPEAQAPQGSTSSGSVTASYAKKADDGRYMLVSPGLQSSGRLTDVQQTATGAAAGGVVTMNANTLSGDLAIQDIAGDESFALGRWSKGTVNRDGTAAAIVGDDGAYHYVVYNALTAFPTSGTYKCDAGKFTAPSRVGGSGNVLGTAAGSATVTFSNGAAVLDAAITATVGAQSGAVSASGKRLDSPAITTITGNYFNSGTGMALTVGEAGNAKVRVVAAYQVAVSGDDYRGVATFSCGL
ncbi:MAG: hypothetical protein J7598_11705 [Mitsuaria chitosanitabida]|uniref:hypothetical protein n=1 Tax=Roseateles chitosanitabidus TaxID=65048 RepID=UPI001B24D8DD|nr:hypothetical protein [Roseateles chitosanitabidus]MBO9687271.1 hypothetical protein [Roseateles chitosanitabidus]